MSAGIPARQNGGDVVTVLRNDEFLNLPDYRRQVIVQNHIR